MTRHVQTLDPAYFDAVYASDPRSVEVRLERLRAQKICRHARRAAETALRACARNRLLDRRSHAASCRAMRCHTGGRRRAGAAEGGETPLCRPAERALR